MTIVRRRLRLAVRPRVLTLLAALSLVISGLLVSRTRADLNAPTATDRQIAMAVMSLMNSQHISRHPLNDEMSQRWLTMFLKSIDPMKLYFTQGDVDDFMRHRNELDDRLKRGDVGFAYEVYKVYLRRLNERIAVIDELLKMEHDFTVDEAMDTDFDKRPYAKDEAELRDRWRKRIKYDLLVLKAAKSEGAEAREKLSKRYHSFARNMRQFTSDDLLELYLTSLTTSYDPHTSYMSSSSLENFEILMRGELEGIGAALQMVDGNTVVTKVILGGAAAKDGRLKNKDQVIGVGQGEDGPIVDVVDMRLNDVVKLIRGKRGSIVRLQVLPGGTGKPIIYNITRQSIELTDSLARGDTVDMGTKPDGRPYKIGVIDLPSFYMDMNGARLGKADFRSTTRDVRKLLDDFRAKGVDAVVLDLRRNGGGALTEAINLTGLFIDDGPVVQVKDADGKVEHYDDEERGVAWDGPLVVLTSKLSASASEIFAGAIQDYRRGIVVGDHTTHGKGTVQSMLDLGRQLFRGEAAPKWGALKITQQQFYRPNGDSTQNRGVVSDIELPSLTTHLDIGEQDQEYALKFDQVRASPFKTVDQVAPPILAELNRRSAERCSASDDFKKVAKRVARYQDQKQRKSITLNEKKYLAERSEFNAEDDDEEKQLEELEAKDRPVIDRKYYFNEALAVTIDYLNLLGKSKVAATR
ncbi:MAG: carboxy terminal-processing peptidase [Planctomycetes bacterium]|nr:carboxy terminal-processing peptidase [Planctomycetota bacterium]